MKLPFLTQLMSRRGRQHSRKTPLTPDDIRRKLADYRKTDGPAEFGAGLYAVQEEEDNIAVRPERDTTLKP